MAQTFVLIATLWALLQRFGTMLISFSTNIVLARLLMPEDFGSIGMLLIFIAVANTFVDGGFGAALIQRSSITQQDKSTVFFSNLGLSFFLYLFLFVTSPWIADFYATPLLSDLLRVQGLVLIIQAFGVVQTALLSKSMDFKKISMSNLIGNVLGAITGIALAYCGFGVWSLVAKTLATTLVTTILLWGLGGWCPSICFSFVSLKKLFGFGGFVLMSSLMMTISNNIQTAILAKMFKLDVVGNFTQARLLRNVTAESLSSIVGQVLYPFFSEKQNDNNILKEKLIQSLSIISYVTTPLMFLCMLNANELIRLLYGDKWLLAIPYFQILCVGGIFFSLQDVNINIIKAKGRSKALFVCNLAKTIYLCLSLIVCAKFWGIYGFLWAMVFYSILAFLLFAILSTKYIRASFFYQCSGIVVNLLIALFPCIVVYYLKSIIVCQSLMSQFTINTIVYLLFFFLVSLITKPFAFRYFVGKIKRMINR